MGAQHNIYHHIQQNINDFIHTNVQIHKTMSARPPIPTKLATTLLLTSYLLIILIFDEMMNFFETSGNFWKKIFSSKSTWEHLRVQSPTMPWHTVIWFRVHIPRFSFIAWLALLRRLLTDISWDDGAYLFHPVCVLCSSFNETHYFLSNSLYVSGIYLAQI